MLFDRESKLLKYLVLTKINGIGCVAQNNLLEICGGINNCFEAEYDDLICTDKMNKIGEKQIRIFLSQRYDKNLWDEAERIVGLSEKSGISLIVRENHNYPNRFRNIRDLPIVIYTKGELRINEYDESIGIVGARRCTGEGKEKAIEIAENAIENNAAVISGMAKGIDSYAHTAAVKSRGYTIAVLGNGPDICYPKEHEKLYSEIIKQGCILSEYPPETIPQRYMFPKRNRLIAALSDKLYVINVGRNSGTETTVEAAYRYGRRVCG